MSDRLRETAEVADVLGLPKVSGFRWPNVKTPEQKRIDALEDENASLRLRVGELEDRMSMLTTDVSMLMESVRQLAAQRAAEGCPPVPVHTMISGPSLLFGSRTTLLPTLHGMNIALPTPEVDPARAVLVEESWKRALLGRRK